VGVLVGVEVGVTVGATVGASVGLRVGKLVGAAVAGAGVGGTLSRQNVAFFMGVYLPRGQALHVVCPVAAPYFPVGHWKQ